MSCMESDAPISKNVYRLPSGIIVNITLHSFPSDSSRKSNSTLDFSNFTWKDFEQVLLSKYFKTKNIGSGYIKRNEIRPLQSIKSESPTNMSSTNLVQSIFQESESSNLAQHKRMVKALHNYCLSPETIYPLNHMAALPNLADLSLDNVAATVTIKNCAQSPSDEDVPTHENLAQQRRLVQALHNYCRCPKREEENRIATKKKLRQYAALVNKQKKKINKLKLQVQMLERSMRCQE